MSAGSRREAKNGEMITHEDNQAPQDHPPPACPPSHVRRAKFR